MKYIVKFVSLDGLTRFEDREGALGPEEYQYRLAGFPVAVRKISEAADLEALNTFRRTYALSDQYTDPDTGRCVFEFKEIP